MGTNNTDQKTHKAWDDRSNALGADMRSVMDQSFPRSINEVIHRIHLNEILSVIPTGTVRCLDVGCGYGRLAYAVEKLRPNARIDGIDIAPAFVKLFNQKMQESGKAITADARKLPFKPHSFDMVWMVVSLMYFPKREDQQNVMKEIYRVLKPGGVFVLIEPNVIGEFIVRWGGLLPKLHGLITRRRNVHTGGIAFWPRHLAYLLKDSGFTVVFQRGYPFVTILLTPLVIIGKIVPRLAAWFLERAWDLDSIFPIASFSYIVTLVGKKHDTYVV